MKSYLVFDTETSNLYNKELPFHHAQQGRLMQFACVLLNEELKEISSFLAYSSEDDYELMPGAFAAHGITKEMAQRFGIPSSCIIETFNYFLEQTDIVVGFNRKFDENIMTVEESLQGQRIVWPDNKVCLMELMTPICKLPSKKNGQYKWPRLSEAYKFAFNEELSNTHDAMGDVKGTTRLLRYAVENKLLTSLA